MMKTIQKGHEEAKTASKDHRAEAETSSIPSSPHHLQDKTLHVAPMLDVSTREFRALIRIMSKRTVLWTEMVVDSTLLFTKELDFHLDFEGDFSHPIICQIGGCKKDWIRQATCKVLEYGYDEINLNLGCPSHRVEGEQNFGALLMKQVNVAEQAVEAMQEASNAYGGQRTSNRTPISVKCRVGVDEYDTLEDLVGFIRRLRRSGCRTFYLHARKAILGGLLCPAKNRDVPPLNYPRVYDICRMFPDCNFYINGGIKNLKDAKDICYGRGLGHQEQQHQQEPQHRKVPCTTCGFPNGSCVAPPPIAPRNLRGCLIGRLAMENPVAFWDVDRYFYGESKNPCQTRGEILTKYCKYLEKIYPRRCCDKDPAKTTKITDPKSFPFEYDYCSKCAPLFIGNHEDCSSVAPPDFGDDHGMKITSHILNRSVKPINKIFFGLPGSSGFRRSLHQLVRSDSEFRNCGPCALILRALLVVPDEFLNAVLVPTEQQPRQYVKVKKGSTKTAGSRISRLVSTAVTIFMVLFLITQTEGVTSASSLNATNLQNDIPETTGQEELKGQDRTTEKEEEESEEDASFSVPQLQPDETGSQDNLMAGEAVAFEEQEVPVMMNFEMEFDGNEEPVQEEEGHFIASLNAVCEENNDKMEVLDDSRKVHTDEANSRILPVEADADSFPFKEEEQFPGIVQEEAMEAVSADEENSEYPLWAEEHLVMRNVSSLDTDTPGNKQSTKSASPMSSEVTYGNSTERNIDDDPPDAFRTRGQASISDAMLEQIVDDQFLDLDEEDLQRFDAARDYASTQTEQLSHTPEKTTEDNSDDVKVESEVTEKQLLEELSFNSDGDRNGKTAPKGSLASFLESASSNSSGNSFSHQLEEHQYLSTGTRRTPKSYEVHHVQYRGEPWGCFKSGRRTPDLDILFQLFKDMVADEEVASPTAEKLQEMLERMGSDSWLDASQVFEFLDTTSDTVFSGETTGREEASDIVASVDSSTSMSSSDANSDFVEGLDDIDKFFEGVDPPDELDVGASGLSIQEVLVGKGRQILVKKILQLTHAISVGCKRMFERVGNLFAQIQDGRLGDGHKRFSERLGIHDLPNRAWNMGKRIVEKSVKVVDGLIDRFDQGDGEEEFYNLDFSAPLSRESLKTET